VVELALEFAPRLVEANPLVEETLNQVTVKYGPLVYCLESNDLPEGVALSDVVLSLANDPRQFQPERARIVNSDVVKFRVPALVLDRKPWTADQLYREVSFAPPRPIEVKLVPYYAWGNRGDTEMSVWLPVR
jgi:uncharacterized protein